MQWSPISEGTLLFGRFPGLYPFALLARATCIRRCRWVWTFL